MLQNDLSPNEAFEHHSPWRTYRGPGGIWRPPRCEGLARVLAKAGYGARPRTEALIQVGRITVNGRVIRDARHAVTPQSEIRMDGEILREAARRHIAMNKPSGVDCQQSGISQYSVGNYLPGDLVGLEPAGRLAARSRGLLLLSNDLWWNTQVCHNSRMKRSFEILVSGRVGEAELGVMSAGMTLPNHGYFKADEVLVMAEREQGSLVRLTMTGGHDRQIRSALKAMRLVVLRLTRIALGPVMLDGLLNGRFRFLDAQEIPSLAGYGG